MAAPVGTEILSPDSLLLLLLPGAGEAVAWWRVLGSGTLLGCLSHQLHKTTSHLSHYKATETLSGGGDSPALP